VPFKRLRVCRSSRIGPYEMPRLLQPPEERLRCYWVSLSLISGEFHKRRIGGIRFEVEFITIDPTNLATPATIGQTRVSRASMVLVSFPASRLR
jgi:hypothetical protein